MKIKYIANDGTQFDTAQECLNHEQWDLSVHISKHCETTFEDDFNCGVISEIDVKEYIIAYIDDINKIINKMRGD